MLPFIFTVSLVGCFESAADKRVRLKTEQNELIDKLYMAYGGSDIANITTVAAQGAAQEAQAQAGQENAQGASVINALAQMATGTINEVDRAAFEANCMAIGMGERPTAISQKAQAFFAQDDVKNSCIYYGKLEREISQIKLD